MSHLVVLHEGLDAAVEDRPVLLLLQWTEGSEDEHLPLRGDRQLHPRLEAAQDERAEDLHSGIQMIQ